MRKTFCGLIIILLVLNFDSIGRISCKSSNDRQKPSQTAQMDVVKWDENVFTVKTLSLADNPIAIWIVTEDGTDSTSVVTISSPKQPALVLATFEKQPVEKKKRGIFIYSGTYATQLTQEDMRWMSTSDRRLFNNSKWRKSQATLIKKLQIECKAKNIPLYVNLTLNLQGGWKKIAP